MTALPGLIAVAAIFAALMLAVGGLKGLRSLLGLCISLYFIFAFLLPTIYRGYSPVLMSFVTVIIIAVFSLLLLNGFSRKTLTAVAATGIGVALAAAVLSSRLRDRCISSATTSPRRKT